MKKTLTTLTIILLLLTSLINAQVVKNKKDNIAKTPNKVEGVTATGDKMTVKDEDSNILMEVTDEGNAGAIYLKPLSSIGTYTDKLYNMGGSLIWNGDALGTAGSAGGWTDDGAVVRLSTASDKVGIGTTTPSAALQVTGNDGVVFEGAFGSGTALSSGTGPRMIWYPKKAAFRAGYEAFGDWDDINIGNYSTAMGWRTEASGSYSNAMGMRAQAKGEYSIAMGSSTVAESYSSTAIGHCNIIRAVVDADHWVATDPLFEIGNGVDVNVRANAVTVLKNGNVGIGTENPTVQLEVTGGKTKLEQEDWQAPVLDNGWINFGSDYNTAGYFKDSNGIVHLRGLIKDGIYNYFIFRLPSGYRPSAKEVQMVISDNTLGRVDIRPDGGVYMMAGSTNWISLDGITFRAQ